MIATVTVTVCHDNIGGVKPSDMYKAIRAIKKAFSGEHPRLSITVKTNIATTDITGFLTDEP